jgi:hypothetical protein
MLSMLRPLRMLSIGSRLRGNDGLEANDRAYQPWTMTPSRPLRLAPYNALSALASSSS